MSDVCGLHAWVSGRVQGVCFRASTAEKARALGLGGWVRNLPDGRVELQAWGPSADLQALEDWLGVGPPAARVDNLERKSIAPGAMSGFELRPTPRG